MIHDGGPLAAEVLELLGVTARAGAQAAPTSSADPWTAAVVSVLDEAGFAPVSSWPSGRHVVDVAAIRPAGPTAIITAIHAEGVDAHIDRHLELARAGWRVLEVFPSRWAERLEKLPDHVDNRWRG